MNTSAGFAGITGRRGMKTKKLKAGKPVKVDEAMPMKGKKAMPFMKKGKRKG